MPHITEPTMQEALWSWLDRRGYEVHGEVPLGTHGVIDLIAYDCEDDLFAGIELKDAERAVPETVEAEAPITTREVTKEVQNPVRESYTRPWGQLAEYYSSGYFNEVYFASQAPDAALENKDNPSVQSAFEDLELDPGDVGGIHISDPLDSESITLNTDATSKNREHDLSLSYTTEQWVQHHVWQQTGDIREAVIPNTNTHTVRRIDIMSFTGSIDPTEVYYNQPDDNIVGIEVKGSQAVNTNADEIRAQLLDYLQCGAVTKLYFAVPDGVRSVACEILSDSGLDHVGLYTVSKDGSLTQVQEPSFVPLEYDGLRLSEGRCIDIGWGRYSNNEDKTASEYYAVFDFGGHI